MRLLKYKVNKFRSVKGTDWIDVDKWACFVGLNESGKTNLLLPLWKFNPADSATGIDLLVDYPRDEYSELAEDASRQRECFIEVLFEIDEQEATRFETLHLEKKQSSTQTDDSYPDTGGGDEQDLESLAIEKIGFERHLLIKKNYQGDFYIHLSNEKAMEKTSDLDEWLDQEVFKEICNAIPRFVYYSEYGNIDSDLYLPHVVNNLDRIDLLSSNERMKARTLRILFKHLKLNPHEILALGQEAVPKVQEQIDEESRNKQERFAKLDSAGARLTKQFREWWSEGNYVFSFNADGEYFRILVSDSDRPEKIELESRSRGLQWFFSFFLVFLSESESNHKDCILLLDEPGLSLHPNAQADLIRFFHQISKKNDLIYTTHLPYMVDHYSLDKVKAVYTENGLTKISNDLSKADKDKKAIQPVNAAIGITASQSLLVGCDIVIVDGVSAQFYLTMIKNHLVAKGKLKPKKELVFIPVGDVKGVKPFVSILQNSQASMPFVLFNSDSAGSRAQSSLKNGFYSNDQEKILGIDTFTGKLDSEIEDLIPINLVVNSFDRLFKTEEGLGEQDVDSSLPIIPQLESFFEKNHLDIKNNAEWKVDLSKKIKQQFKDKVPDDLEKRWDQLFESLQG